MRLGWMATGAAALLSACATMQDRGPAEGAPRAIERDEIRYETTACYGTCPVYVVTVRPDGSGLFEGVQHTAVTGRRPFRAGPDAYRRFAAALAAYRPAEGERLYEMGSPLCGGPMVSDMPSVDIRWTEASGGSRHLRLYYGCGSETMRAAIRAAPEALPIAGFIRNR